MSGVGRHACMDSQSSPQQGLHMQETPVHACSPRSLRPLVLAVALALASLAASAQNTSAASAPQVAWQLNIPAQPAPQALQQLVEQTRVQLIYSPDLVRGVTTKAVAGRLTPMQALARMLEGTGLQAVETGANAVTIRPTQPAPIRNESGGAPEKADGSATGLTQTSLQTVYVSGNRRREPVREVPMAVDTQGAEALQTRGAQKLTDYVSTLPGLQVSSGGGKGLQQLSIRGVTLGADINPPTSSYLDDVPLGASTQFGAKLSFDMGLMDLNHLEVYRGPQGTLYGASALGGVLKYVSNDVDTDEFSGEARLTLSSTRHGSVNTSVGAVLNVPLQSQVAGLRVAALSQRDAGYTDAFGPLPGERADRSETNGIRVSALFLPTTKLSVKLTAMGQRIKRDGNDYTDYRADGQPVRQDFMQERTVAEPFEQRVELMSADIEYQLGWALFNSVTSHQTNRNHYVTDLSTFYVPLMKPVMPDLVRVFTQTRVDTRKDTQEFRLTSPKSRSFEWLAGVFFTRENDYVVQSATFGMRPGVQDVDAAAVRMPATFREAAVFGDVTFYPTSDWAVTGGVRRSHNRQSLVQLFDAGAPPGATTASAASSDDSTTYLLTARRNLGKDSSVYARLATGYNPGGANAARLDPATGASQNERESYGPNTLTSAELGYKAQLMDGRLALEGAVYRLDWKDIQLAHATAVGSEVVNGGRARIDGVELSATLRPSEQWTMGLSLSAIDARLSDDVPDLKAVQGDKLPVTARFSASLRADYAFSLAGSPASAGLDYRYLGSRNTGFPGATDARNWVMPGYGVLGLHASVVFKGVTLNGFVRNALDRRGQNSVITGYLPLGGPMRMTFEEPRTVGITASASF